MVITFFPLSENHCSLLLKWLEAPHVKAWWDQDVQWTPALIQEKYGTYVDGYKLENDSQKPLYAYIVLADQLSIGYIQFYNAYDFRRSILLTNLPSSLAALDLFIGDPSYLGKGLGSIVLKQFLEEHVHPLYETCFVDPNLHNIAAIKTYENAGFKKIKIIDYSGEIWMLRKINKLSK